MDPRELRRHGQSVWLDFMSRHLLASGELARLVREDGLGGVTSNPTIFEKAIDGSADYDPAIQRYEAASDLAAQDLYERLAVEDIQRAADVLRTVYDATDRDDGFASLEVSPGLAHDTAGTITEARRLWRELGRENVMIKVPGTAEGVPAISQLTSEGINVNVTLLFGRDACARVADAYTTGLETYAAHGGDVRRVASVASVFVSRIDTMLTPLLEAASTGRGGTDALRRSLVGKVAIANARLAYQDWKKRCAAPRWRALAAQGAHAQKMLWASTSTKDPRFGDLTYVEALIGPDTIDTMPPATLAAFRDHGAVRDRLLEDVEGDRQVMADLAAAGFSIDDIADRLVEEGVTAFSGSFAKVISTLERKRATLGSQRSSRRTPEPTA